MSSGSYDSASVPSFDLALLQNHEFAAGSFHESQEERKIIESNQSHSPNNEMEIENIIIQHEQQPKNEIRKQNFNFPEFKCPKHFKEEISFICNAPACQTKFMCCKCLVDDLRNKTRHHIIHENFLVQYENNFLKSECDKIRKAEENFKNIRKSEDFIILEKLENEDYDEFIKDKEKKEKEEICKFMDDVKVKAEEVYNEYKTKIEENVKLESKTFLNNLTSEFVQVKNKYLSQITTLKTMRDNLFECFTSKTSNNLDIIENFIRVAESNDSKIIYEEMTKFLEESNEKIKKFSIKNSNSIIKQQFYVKLNESLRDLINSMIPKNKTRLDYQKILIYSLSEKNILKNNEQTNEKFETKIVPIKEIEVECHPIADICIIGPLNNNEYFVATCSSKEKFIKIWSFPTENKGACLFKTLEGHNKSTFKLFYCHERKSLLSAGIDGSVKSWDIAKNYDLGLYYKEESDPVNAIAHNPNLDLFATSHTLFIRIWRINKEIFVKNECEYSILQPTDILILLNNPENTIIIVGSEKGSIFFLDLQSKTLKLRREEQGVHKKGVWKLIDMKKYNIFLSCSKEDYIIMFWSSKDLLKIKEFKLENEKLLKGICWNPSKNEIYCSFGINEVSFLKTHCIENDLDVHLIDNMKVDENLQIFYLGLNENILVSACKNTIKKDGSSQIRFFLF